MAELHLDLTADATRASLVRQIAAQLPEGAVAQAEEDASEAGVPNRHHHDLADILQTIDGLRVPDAVKENMRGIYTTLTRAEASVHGTTMDQAHFHEVGRPEGIANVVLVCLLLQALGASKVTATPVQMGSGTVNVAHGCMSVPAPATAAILREGIPVCEDRLEGELCTPTSAAMIKQFVTAFETQGYRLGTPPAAPAEPVPEHGHHHHGEHGHEHAHEGRGHAHEGHGASHSA